MRENIKDQKRKKKEPIGIQEPKTEREHRNNESRQEKEKKGTSPGEQETGKIQLERCLFFPQK